MIKRHTHTHTHTEIEIEIEIDRERERANMGKYFRKYVALFGVLGSKSTHFFIYSSTAVEFLLFKFFEAI